VTEPVSGGLAAQLAGLAPAFALGAAVAGGYLSLLWLSVRSLARGRRPLVRLLAGGAVRLALVVAAFFWIAGEGWPALIAALLGFLLIRFAVTRLALAGMAAARTPR
jgi:F1F0 ATPase subunit 2